MIYIIPLFVKIILEGLKYLNKIVTWFFYSKKWSQGLFMIILVYLKLLLIRNDKLHSTQQRKILSWKCLFGPLKFYWSKSIIWNFKGIFELKFLYRLNFWISKNIDCIERKYVYFLRIAHICVISGSLLQNSFFRDVFFFVQMFNVCILWYFAFEILTKNSLRVTSEY